VWHRRRRTRRQTCPIDIARDLRELVHHLAIGALPSHQELERSTRQCEVTVAVDRVHRVERVAAEVPAEAGPRRIARSIVSRDETCLARRECSTWPGAGAQLTDRSLSPQQVGIEF